VGTYYESPAPDRLRSFAWAIPSSQASVLCIIESMKLMNEIEAEVGGVIVSKLVENGNRWNTARRYSAIRPR